MHVITAQYLKKERRIELIFLNMIEEVVSKKLTAPFVFPIVLNAIQHSFKLSLDYDRENKIFLLHINDVAFHELPS